MWHAAKMELHVVDTNMASHLCPMVERGLIQGYTDTSTGYQYDTVPTEEVGRGGAKFGDV